MFFYLEIENLCALESMDNNLTDVFYRKEENFEEKKKHPAFSKHLKYQ